MNPLPIPSVMIVKSIPEQFCASVALTLQILFMLQVPIVSTNHLLRRLRKLLQPLTKHSLFIRQPLIMTFGAKLTIHRPAQPSLDKTVELPQPIPPTPQQHQNREHSALPVPVFSPPLHPMNGLWGLLSSIPDPTLNKSTTAGVMIRSV